MVQAHAVGIAFGVQFKIKRGAQLPACANGLHTMQDNPAAGAVGALISGKADIAVDAGDGAGHFRAAV